MSSSTGSSEYGGGGGGGSPRKDKTYHLSNKRVITTPSWARTLPRDEIEYLYDYNAPPPSSIAHHAPKRNNNNNHSSNRNRSLSSVLREPPPTDSNSNSTAKPSPSPSSFSPPKNSSSDPSSSSTGSNTPQPNPIASSSSFNPSRTYTSSRSHQKDSSAQRLDRSSHETTTTTADSHVLRISDSDDQDQDQDHDPDSGQSSSSAQPLTPLPEAHDRAHLHRQGGAGGAGTATTNAYEGGPRATNNAGSAWMSQSGPEAVSVPPNGDRWWTFTLPSKYLARVHEYVNRLEGEGRNDGTLPISAKEKEGPAHPDSTENEKLSLEGGNKSSYARQMSMSMATKLSPSNVFSLNHTQTPGWSTPWQPFQRDEESINVHRDPFSLVQEATAQQSKSTRFENFILHHVFAPLVFRAINLVLAACTLGIASHIRLQEARSNVIGIIGSSTLFVIIVSPFSIVHIFATVYIEYFGPPIGIWNVRTKMAHTLLELVFICLWSAILSLAFDDLFTSSLECTAFTPYARYNQSPASVGSASVDGTVADSICSQQIAQVVFIFLSVMLYMAVLIVSLLRIFVRVSRKT